MWQSSRGRHNHRAPYAAGCHQVEAPADERQIHGQRITQACSSSCLEPNQRARCARARGVGFDQLVGRPRRRLDQILVALGISEAQQRRAALALAEGHVVEVRVLPDDSMFVVAVMAALKNARFSPATEDGKPIPYWAVLDFSFKIDGPTAADGRRLDR